MTLTVFIVDSGEMVPAVLPQVAADLDVSPGRAGRLLSALAATVVVASFLLARLTPRIDRPTVIGGALAAFAVASLVTASAETYAAALGSRLGAAGVTGLLWSTVNAYATAIVPEHRIARATVVVLFGGTLGTVPAIPWKTPSRTCGLVGAVRRARRPCALLRRSSSSFAATPFSSGPRATQPGGQPRGALSPRRSGPAGGFGALFLGGHFVAFTFVAEVLASSVVPTPALLLTFGWRARLGSGWWGPPVTAARGSFRP